MTKSESAQITAQTVLLESAEQVLQLRSAAGVRLAIPDTNNLIMVGTADWIAANVPGVEVVAEGEQPAIGRLLDAFSALPVLWGLDEPGALVRHSDVFKMLVTAGKTYLAATTQASTAQAGIPADWRDRIFNAMDEAFDITQRQGKSHDGALVIDDTQLGVEFAIKQIEGMLGATDAQEAATSSTDAQPPRTKAQIIALANAAGIDTDDEGDIFGSTNDAIFAFAEALGVRAVGDGCEHCVGTYCLLGEKCRHCGHEAESQGVKRSAGDAGSGE